MNWAWLTPYAGPLLVTTSSGLSPVEINEEIAHDAPYILLSLLCTSTGSAPLLFLDVLCFDESQAGLGSLPLQGQKAKKSWGHLKHIAKSCTKLGGPKSYCEMLLCRVRPAYI